jgi:hypothetical protein
MAIGEDVIAGPNNELVVIVVEPAASAIRISGGLLQNRVG